MNQQTTGYTGHSNLLVVCSGHREGRFCHFQSLSRCPVHDTGISWSSTRLLLGQPRRSSDCTWIMHSWSRLLSQPNPKSKLELQSTLPTCFLATHASLSTIHLSSHCTDFQSMHPCLSQHEACSNKMCSVCFKMSKLLDNVRNQEYGCCSMAPFLSSFSVPLHVLIRSSQLPLPPPLPMGGL